MSCKVTLFHTTASSTDLCVELKKHKANSIEKGLWKKIDETAFLSDLKQTVGKLIDSDNINDLVNKYNTELELLADKLLSTAERRGTLLWFLSSNLCVKSIGAKSC